jgi:hypothetical protein
MVTVTLQGIKSMRVSTSKIRSTIVLPSSTIPGVVDISLVEEIRTLDQSIPKATIAVSAKTRQKQSSNMTRNDF